MFDTRYLSAGRPESYVSMTGQTVLDPTRNHVLAEDGHRQTSPPEPCAWRVFLSIKRFPDTYITHPLTESDAIEYEALLRSQLGDVATTELRPVMGWSIQRDTVGPHAGEKWTHHAARDDQEVPGLPGLVVNAMRRAVEASEAGDLPKFQHFMTVAAHHAEKVACSDHQEMTQAIQEVGLPPLPCRNPNHVEMFHSNPTAA